MTSSNEPWLSNFERRELSREDSGELPWSIQGGERGQQAVYEGRVEGHGEWAMNAIFDIDRPGSPLVELRLFPASQSPPADGLTVDVLRSIRVSPLHVGVREYLQLPFNTKGHFDVDRNESGGARRPGRGGRKDRYYAEWSARYLNACRENERPIPLLAHRYHLKESTIRGFLGEARRRGLLTPAPTGKAGGQLTDKAKRELDGTH
jgi:hypothetical protein